MRTAALVSAFLLATVCLAQAPDGWKAAGDRAYSPTDLKPGETLTVTYLDDANLGGATLHGWLLGAIAKESEVAGLTPKVLNESPHAIIAAVQKGGLSYLYTAVSPDGRTVHWMRIVISGGPTMNRYNAGIRALSARLNGSAGTAPAAATGKPKAGGPIQEGVYLGTQFYGPKPRLKMRLELYADGEYRILYPDGKEDTQTGRYRYDPKTGLLDVSSLAWLNTNHNDLKDALCFFAHDGQGHPFVHSDNNRGFSRATITLLYTGAPSRPSPEREVAMKAAAEAEAKRYKFTTAVGKGLPASQVVAVVHSLRNEAQGMGSHQVNTITVLLRDGTAYDGFPVPFEVWNVPLSRQREPAKWGRWHRAGNGYAVAYGGESYRPLPGEVGRPAPANLRLNGRWGSGESSGSLITGSSYRLWGITFSSDGRFVRDGSGGSASSMLGQTMNGVSVNTQYDDAGSYTSAVTPGVVVGTGHKGGPDAGRTGTYRFDGYTLVLSYADGRVVREPFFMEGSGPTPDIWFAGNTMPKDRK